MLVEGKHNEFVGCSGLVIPLTKWQIGSFRESVVVFVMDNYCGRQSMSEIPTHLFNIPKAGQPVAIINAISNLFQAVFPDRIRAIYLIGSRAEQSAASISDIDGVILFKDGFVNDAEQDLAQAIMAQCQLLSPIRLDFSPIAENNERLTSGIDVRLKLGSHLVSGEDIRDKLPLPSIEAYQTYLRDWQVSFLTAIHDIEELRYPLDYPDYADEFFGYTRKRAIPWYPPEVQSGTKELVATICWVATALLAFEARVFVGSRADCLRLSQEHLREPWSEFVQQAYQKCKLDWDYQVPNTIEERADLREICRQALPFFNEYLKLYGQTEPENDQLIV